jgi:TolA-binding protein
MEGVMRLFSLPVVLAGCLLAGALAMASEQAVPSPVSERFPKIKASLEDGFYALAELQAADALSSKLSKKDELEAVLLMSHALWGQGRNSELLDLLSRYNGEAGFVYWRARGQYELGLYAESLDQFKQSEGVLAESRFAAPAMRLRGHVEMRLGLPEQAVKSFLQFEIQFPAHADRTGNQFDLAEAYQAQKKLPEAMGVLKNLIAGEDASAARLARLRLGHLLYTQGAAEHYPEARTILTGLAVDKNTPLVLQIDAYLDLAALEEKAGDRKAAGEALKQAIVLSPDARQRVPLKLSLARLLLRERDTAGALKLLEECRVEAPNETIAAELQLEKAGALLMAGDFESADAAYQVYLDVSSNSQGRSNAYLGKGLALWELSRFMEAAVAFDKADAGLTEVRDRAVALFKAADAYYRANRFDMAAERYGAFLARFSDHEWVPNALYQLGMAQKESERALEARKSFERLETEYPKSPFAEQAAMRAADIDYEMRAWDSVLTRYERIAAVYTNAPVLALSYYRRGRVLYTVGRYDEALKAFERVESAFPESEYAPQASFMRGRCLSGLGKFEEAIKTCEAFIKQYPKSDSTPKVMFWLAEQHFNAGRYADSEQLFLEISEQFKGRELAAEALYWAGRSADALGNYVKAIERYSAVKTQYPESDVMPDMRFAQGDAMSQLGQFSRAILAFEEIIKNYPQSHLVDAAWGRKGDCQFSMGKDQPDRYAESILSYQAILDRPSARQVLKLQAWAKMGRSHEKMGQPGRAFVRYMDAVDAFLFDQVERSEDAVHWFTRAAYGAAAIKEKEHQWMEVVRIYKRVVESGVPAGEDAKKRIEAIRREHWLLFQQAGEI